MRKLSFFLFLLFFVSLSYGSTLEDALTLAGEKNLAENSYWEVLLHYKKGWFSGYRSLVDDPAFFLSPEGKTDATAELAATIEALLKADEGDPDSHALCRFPARAAWLADELPMLGDAYPEAACPHFELVTGRILPSSASLVFPFSSMADPASIFGHTMLRLEKADSSPLLGYAVTYGANADGAGPMKYIVYGIGGGFEGRHTVLPYASKLNEYTAIDLRDIWEYRLDFTPEEVFRMYLHIWEMSLVVQDYYFFDENCAFNLLFFMEAARPGLNLTDQFTVTFPVNTIKALSEAGLVQEIVFRPSHVKKMHSIAEQLSYNQISTAKDIAKGKLDPSEVGQLDIPDEEKVAVLDLSSELVRYYNKRVSASELEIYQKRSVAILMQRSKIRMANDYIVPVPEVTPEKAHNSARVLIGGGYGADSPFIDAGFRFSYHSLEDNVNGYIDGMQVVTMDVNGRYYTETEHFSLHRLILAEVTNLQPMTRLFKSSSWFLSSGMEDRSLSAENSDYVWYADGGIGATVRLTENSYAWLSGMVEVQAASDRSPDITAGVGPRGGFMLRTGDFGALILDGRYLLYLGDSDHAESAVSAKYSFYPAINHAFVAEVTHSTQYDRWANEYSLTWRFFF